MIHILRAGFGIVDSWTRRRTILNGLASLALALLESAAFGLLYLLLSVLTQAKATAPRHVPVLSSVIGPVSSQSAARLGVLVTVLMLVKSSSAALLLWWQSGVQAKTEARLASKLFGDYLSQGYLVHLRQHSSVLIRNLMTSVGMVATQVVGAFTTALTDVLVLIGVAITLSLVQPLVAAAGALFIVAVAAGYLFTLAPVIHRAAARDQDVTQETVKLMQESFGNVKAIQAYDVTNAVVAEYGQLRTILARTRQTLTSVQRLPQYYLEVCMVLGIASSAAVLALFSKRGDQATTIGLLVAASLRVLPSVNRILNSLNAIRSGGPAIDILAASQPPHLHPTTDRAAEMGSLTFNHSLEFDRVSFTYPVSADFSLQGITFSIPARSSVGIVGQTGAGKTTLVDILLGLLPPSQGELRVDGLAITPERWSDWRHLVAYVPQEPYLIDESIRSNIEFYRMSADNHLAEEALWDALELAQLATFVRSLPDGLDTHVGEHGARLSGGQRQRLGIARALVLKPQVLILDEATSALDATTERSFIDTLSALRQRMTIVIIAHRLSTVKWCDQLLMLSNGAVAATGTFDDLQTHSEVFLQMVRMSAVTGPEGSQIGH